MVLGCINSVEESEIILGITEIDYIAFPYENRIKEVVSDLMKDNVCLTLKEYSIS